MDAVTKVPRSLNWKTTHERNNRPSSLTSGSANIHSNHQFEHIPQFHSYKPSASFRSTFGTRSSSIEDDNYERNVVTSRRMLSKSMNCRGDRKTSFESSFDNDLGLDDDLDNILSGIEGLYSGSSESPPVGIHNGIHESIGDRIQIEEVKADVSSCEIAPTQENSSFSHNFVRPESTISCGNPSHTKSQRLRILPVNFDPTDSSILRDSSKERIDDEHDVPEIESTPLSDGDVTNVHKIVVNTKREQLLSSGFNDSVLRSSIISLDDGENIAWKSSANEQVFPANRSIRNTSDNDAQEKLNCEQNIFEHSSSPKNVPMEKKPDPISHFPLSGTISIMHRDENSLNMLHSPADKEYDNDATKTLDKASHLGYKSEASSIVTSQTQSPFIFTYSKRGDDDSVSQITSSVTASIGSSYLRNVPTRSYGEFQNAVRTNGITWMSGQNLNRMSYRKGGVVASGSFGRDRIRRGNKDNSFVSTERNGGTGNNIIINGSDDVTEEGGRSNLDEIAYALNADCTSGKRTVSVMNSRQARYATRRMSSLECLVEKSNLSIGGGSGGGRSVSTVSKASSSSSSSRGIFQGIAMLIWKAQLHAGRFFLPTSTKISLRKKHDRSDSLDDILLEEGANVMLQRNKCTHYVETEEDVDYFGRAMSSSRSPTQSNMHHNSTTLWSTFLMMTLALTIYTISKQKNKSNQSFSSQVSKINIHGFQSEDFTSQDKISGVTNEDTQPDIFVRDYPRESQFSDHDFSERDWSYFHGKNETLLPQVFEAIADVDGGPFQKGIEIPFYWHVPRSGGGTVNDVLGSCLQLTLASDVGGSGDLGNDSDLKVLHLSRHVSYVNVDTSSRKGIQRAKHLNLVSSGLADVVMSPLLHDASSLFTTAHKGRIFIMLRHPIERAASLFYFIQDTQWKHPGQINEKFSDMSIEDFYRGGFAENNWMTRFLINELTKPDLTEQDLETAKKVLKQKCLVGLLEKKTQSFDRFQKYFGWKIGYNEMECIEKKVQWTWPMKHKHATIEKGSNAWYLISEQNVFDLQLYDYAKELFQQQEKLIYL